MRSFQGEVELILPDVQVLALERGNFCHRKRPGIEHLDQQLVPRKGL
jgi:hypothetical protein